MPSLPWVNPYKTAGLIQKLAGCDGNDPSVDIAKDADQRF